MGQIGRHGELFEMQQCTLRQLSGGQRGRTCEIFGGAVVRFAEHRGEMNRQLGLLASDQHQETDPDQYWPGFWNHQTGTQCCEQWGIKELSWENTTIMLFPDFSRATQMKRDKFRDCKKKLHEQGVSLGMLFLAKLRIETNRRECEGFWLSLESHGFHWCYAVSTDGLICCHLHHTHPNVIDTSVDSFSRQQCVRWRDEWSLADLTRTVGPPLERLLRGFSCAKFRFSCNTLLFC